MASKFVPWICKSHGHMVVVTDYDATFVSQAKSLGAQFTEITSEKGNLKGWRMHPTKSNRFERFAEIIEEARARYEAKLAQRAEHSAKIEAKVAPRVKVTSSNLTWAMENPDSPLYG
jgi:hypothetical protein